MIQDKTLLPVLYFGPLGFLLRETGLSIPEKVDHSLIHNIGT
jgi:hypothetical protein